MSTEIINVLNYIGETFGIVIDWTSENVLPQVLDILGRYRLFKIVECSIWLPVFIVIAIILVHFGKQFISNYKSCYNNHDENFWFYYSSYWGEVKFNAPSFIYVVCIIFYLMFALVGIPIIISEILKWVFIPEIQYLEMLRGYIQ